jgi:hypothetical protein
MKDKLVLDLETKKSFDEVGGQQNQHLLEVSVVGVYSYNRDQYRAFRENDFKELEIWLKEASLVIGFNTKKFDYAVLQPYYKFRLDKLPSLDILEEVYFALGRRLKLDSLAQVTLGKGKIASGLDAIMYYRNNDWQNLEKYCLDDVRITKEIYEFGQAHGHLWYENNGQREKIKVRWAQDQTVGKLLQEALAKGQQAEIVYFKEDGDDGNSRKIDIRYIKDNKVHAFCHLRQELRIFEIDKILKIKIVGSMSSWQKKLF